MGWEGQGPPLFQYVGLAGEEEKFNINVLVICQKVLT